VQQWDGYQRYIFGNPDFAKAVSNKPKKEKFEMYQKGITQSANLLASTIKVKMRADSLWSEEVTGKIDAGNLLHEALKRVKHEGDEETVLNKMKAGGLLSEDEKTELHQKLKAVVYHPELNALFKKGVKVITERPLLKQDQGLRIPDRVLLINGGVTILDYKTGQRETAHKLQLNNYGRWLEEAGLKVKEKILFYTAEQMREVVA
jgi:ATP-dependent exoDNAse (exonuclease V) beta subunit